MAIIIRESFKTQAYNYIKQCISEGTLEKNVVYTETYISGILGISRTPVREAVLQLVSEDIAELKPNKGFVIKNHSMDEITEYLEVRRAVELFAGMQTMKTRGTKEWNELTDRLRIIVKSSEEAVINRDLTGFARADAEFHQTVVDYTGNRLLKRMLSDARTITDASAVYRDTDYRRQADIVKEHKMIADAIRRGERYDIAKAYDYHFDMCLKAVRRACEEA